MFTVELALWTVEAVMKFFIFFQYRPIFNYVLRGHYGKCAFGAISF